MEKELKELLKELKKLRKVVTDKDMEKAKENFSKQMEEAIKTPCEISIKKENSGLANMKVEGKRLAILVTLAGAEKGILKQLHCTEDEFDFIKNFVGSREYDNE